MGKHHLLRDVLRLCGLRRGRAPVAAQISMARGAKGHWPPRVALALRPGGRPRSRGRPVTAQRWEKGDHRGRGPHAPARLRPRPGCLPCLQRGNLQRGEASQDKVQGSGSSSSMARRTTTPSGCWPWLPRGRAGYASSTSSTWRTRRSPRPTTRSSTAAPPR